METRSVSVRDAALSVGEGREAVDSLGHSGVYCVRRNAVRLPGGCVQERIGQQIADTLVAMLAPHGVAVFLEAHHLCVEMRGVRDISPVTRTTVWRGEFETNPDLRMEFFTACGRQR